MTLAFINIVVFCPSVQSVVENVRICICCLHVAAGDKAGAADLQASPTMAGGAALLALLPAVTALPFLYTPCRCSRCTLTLPSEGEGSLHDHTLPLLDGSANVSLSDYAGKVVDPSLLWPGRPASQRGDLLRVRHPVRRLQCTEGHICCRSVLLCMTRRLTTRTWRSLQFLAPTSLT